MWTLADKSLESRVLLGTALYPSPSVMAESIEACGCDVVTVSLRRQSPTDRAGAKYWALIQQLDVEVLPNTAGCRTAKEAINTAKMARDLFDTHWIKLEVIADDYTLAPEPAGLVRAAADLANDGFFVLPYTNADLDVARQLLDAGCKAVMPWASMIGSGQGLVERDRLMHMRDALPATTLIVDAGLGKPSDATQAMELGFDGVLLNSAVALADDPPRMAKAFAQAVEAGRLGFEAGLMAPRDLASPSTPTIGTPFWQQENQQV